MIDLIYPTGVLLSILYCFSVRAFYGESMMLRIAYTFLVSFFWFFIPVAFLIDLISNRGVCRGD